MPEWLTRPDMYMQALVLCCFVIVFIVQLKIMSAMRSQLSLIMFYGKQIEEIRKMLGGAGARRLPEVSQDESGLYEVLRE